MGREWRNGVRKNKQEVRQEEARWLGSWLVRKKSARQEARPSLRRRRWQTEPSSYSTWRHPLLALSPASEWAEWMIVVRLSIDYAVQESVFVSSERMCTAEFIKKTPGLIWGLGFMLYTHLNRLQSTQAWSKESIADKCTQHCTWTQTHSHSLVLSFYIRLCQEFSPTSQVGNMQTCFHV